MHVNLVFLHFLSSQIFQSVCPSVLQLLVGRFNIGPGKEYLMFFHTNMIRTSFFSGRIFIDEHRHKEVDLIKKEKLKLINTQKINRKSAI